MEYKFRYTCRQIIRIHEASFKILDHNKKVSPRQTRIYRCTILFWTDLKSPYENICIRNFRDIKLHNAEGDPPTAYFHLIFVPNFLRCNPTFRPVFFHCDVSAIFLLYILLIENFLTVKMEQIYKITSLVYLNRFRYLSQPLRQSWFQIYEVQWSTLKFIKTYIILLAEKNIKTFNM